MKKGISLISLMATIAILIILITTVTISGIQSSNNAKKITFATEIFNIQNSVDEYKLKNSGDFPIKDIVSVDLSNVTANSLTQFDGENISNNRVNLYEIDYDKLNITSLKYGNKTDTNNDIYAISQDTGRVYYVKGFKIASKTYFTLTDDLKKSINYSTNLSDTNVNNGIIFIASNTEWTNKNVDVTAKIPKNFVDVSVKINNAGDNLTPSSTSDTNYDIYNITGVSGNYQINIAYKLETNGDVKNSTYTVENVDNVSPVIVIDSNNQKLMKNTQDSSKSYAYANITSKSDNLSGIKQIKYEDEKISQDQIGAYFKSNGKVITGNSIPIDKGATDITVYIEDNAGNWTASFFIVSSEVYSGLLD